MATKESKRVIKQRKQNYDRFSVLTEKGGNQLLRVLALREGVSIAEMIRRAILARGGLNLWPYDTDMQELAKITTREEARSAVFFMQNRENAKEIMRHLVDELGPEPSNAEYITRMDNADIAEFREAVNKINAAIEAEGPEDSVFAPSVTVKLYGREIGIMRRMLANIERVPQDTDTKK